MQTIDVEQSNKKHTKIHQMFALPFTKDNDGNKFAIDHFEKWNKNG